MEMVPSSTLTVVSSSSNIVTVDQLLIIRRYLPKHAVFYDIPAALRTKLAAFQDSGSSFHQKQSATAESRSFIADQWKVFTLY
jgi:hypothetical protein